MEAPPSGDDDVDKNKNEQKLLLLVGAFVWMTDNDNNKLTMWDMIQAGLWMVPFKFGITTYKRLMYTIHWYDTMNGTIYGISGTSGSTTTNTNDHHDLTTTTTTTTPQNIIIIKIIKLNRMVILPEYQGMGIGTCALRQMFEREEFFLKNESSKKKSKNEPNVVVVKIRLKTQTQHNVKFYETKLGFHVLKKQGFVGLESSSVGDDGRNSGDTTTKTTKAAAAATTTTTNSEVETTGSSHVTISTIDDAAAAEVVAAVSGSSASATTTVVTPPPVLYYSWFMELEM